MDKETLVKESIQVLRDSANNLISLMQQYSEENCNLKDYCPDAAKELVYQNFSWLCTSINQRITDPRINFNKLTGETTITLKNPFITYDDLDEMREWTEASLYEAMEHPVQGKDGEWYIVIYFNTEEEHVYAHNEMENFRYIFDEYGYKPLSIQNISTEQFYALSVRIDNVEEQG